MKQSIQDYYQNFTFVTGVAEDETVASEKEKCETNKQSKARTITREVKC